MLSETGFLFADGVTIDLNGNNFSFEDGTITIVLEAPSVAVYGAAEQELLSNYGITFANAGAVTGFEDDITVNLAYYQFDEQGNVTIGDTIGTTTLSSANVTVQSVPEPTTATLSLLALAGLCARRRRA